MTASLIFACIWALLATVAALLPRHIHWPAAYALIGIGIPLLGWVTYQNGPVWGLLVLAGGMSMLRWSLVHFWRWLCLRAGWAVQ
ncbi:MAG: DUF2484 family protein [Pseudorhodobacter sp.]|nr:DUF2484 family protein [Pseudorhodobacter sp.]